MRSTTLVSSIYVRALGWIESFQGGSHPVRKVGVEPSGAEERTRINSRPSSKPAGHRRSCGAAPRGLDGRLDFPLLARLLRDRAAAADLLFGVHGAATGGRAAVAGGFLVTTVVEAIIVGDFLARRDVADGPDPHTAFDFFRLAIWIAAVIDEHGHTVAVDHYRAVAESKKVSDD